MKRILLAGLCAGALCLSLLPGPAMAQDESVTSREGIALQNQILAIQNQVQQMQAQLQQVQASGGGNGGGGQAPADAGGSGPLVTQLLQRVSTLEDEVRTLTGNLQQLQNQVDTQNAQVNKQIGDITFQMQNGAGSAGGTAGGSTGSAPGAPPPPPAAPTVAAPTPENLMQNGVIALHEGHYQESEGIARELLAKHRSSPRAYDAQYLLAQSLQGEQRYQEAAPRLRRRLQHEPQGTAGAKRAAWPCHDAGLHQPEVRRLRHVADAARPVPGAAALSGAADRF